MKNFLISLTLILTSLSAAAEPIDIGSRRELFVDDHLIEKLTGARRLLHHPEPQEIAIAHDKPWEGAGSGYHSSNEVFAPGRS